MDQMSLFSYGGDTAADGRIPELPNIGSIAEQGVAFRNTWPLRLLDQQSRIFYGPISPAHPCSGSIECIDGLLIVDTPADSVE